MEIMETFIKTIDSAHGALGLSPYAEQDEIRKAWRSKARETHPDHGGSADAFRAVQAAAEILLVEGVREYYEAESCRTAASGAATQTSPPPYGHRATASEPEPVRPRTRRHPTLLAGAVFGYLIAPHLNQFGVTWYPISIVGELMRYLDSFFLIGWFFVKKRVH